MLTGLIVIVSFLAVATVGVEWEQRILEGH